MLNASRCILVHLGYIHAGCALTDSLTVVSAVLAAVCHVFHAEPAVDRPSVVVPEASLLPTAIVVWLASLFPGEHKPFGIFAPQRMKEETLGN